MTVAEIERIGSPEIPRHDARRAFLEYRRALTIDPANKEAEEWRALMQGYRAIMRGQQVIDLHKTMHTAGVQEDTLYPRLAICRATAQKCIVSMSRDGAAVFLDERYRMKHAPKQRITLPVGTFPLYNLKWNAGVGSQRLRPSGALERERWTESASAIVPIVPPWLRPRNGGLALYHIVWDAVWTPAPPIDPLLVRHLAGALYAIVAHWDLSPLEQAVLRGRL